MSLLIAGCGYLGTALGKTHVDNQESVWGICRSQDTLQRLKTAGISPIQADLNELVPNDLMIASKCDAVVACQSPSRESDSYSITYHDATQNLLKACKDFNLKKFIFISSTSVYGDHNGEWVDENTPCKPVTDNAKCLLETENMVLASSLPTIVLRLAGIYGPGRNRADRLAKGEVKPVFGDAYTNRIHVYDIVQAIDTLIEKGSAGEIYVGADDEPATEKDFNSWMCEKLGLPKDTQTGKSYPQRGSKRCKNQKLKQLGVEWKYPSYKEGYSALIP